MSATAAAREERIGRMYAAFNARDIDAVLVELSADVRWANMMDGGHVEGPEGVRGYWTRQFAEISSTVDPERFESPDDDVVLVTVHQVVRSLDDSEVLSDSTVRHRFTFSDGGISGFDIL